MKVLIDTCIVIDFLQNRRPFADDAKILFQYIAIERLNGYITAKSATDIYYLTQCVTHSDKTAHKILSSLLSLVGMLDTLSFDIFSALTSATTDFEDAVMIETASRSKIDIIITRNKKDFQHSSIPVYNPSEFLNKLSTE